MNLHKMNQYAEEIERAKLHISELIDALVIAENNNDGEAIRDIQLNIDYQKLMKHNLLENFYQAAISKDVE